MCGSFVTATVDKAVWTLPVYIPQSTFFSVFANTKDTCSIVQNSCAVPIVLSSVDFA